MSSLNWPSSMPYDTISVHDQTTYQESTNTVDTTTVPSDPIAFIPFVSPKGYGKDEELVYLNSSSITKYGNPDYNKYGLSLYLAKQFIAGGGNVLGMRLKAANATHANVGVYAKVSLNNNYTRTELKTSAYTNKVIICPKLINLSGTQLSTIPEIIYEVDSNDKITGNIMVEQKTGTDGSNEAVTDKYRVEKLTIETTVGNITIPANTWVVKVKTPDVNADGSNKTDENDNIVYVYTITYKLFTQHQIDSEICTICLSGDDATSKAELEKKFLSLDTYNKEIEVYNKYAQEPLDPYEFIPEGVFGDTYIVQEPETDENGKVKTDETTGEQVMKDVTYTYELSEGKTYIIPLFLFYSLSTGANNFRITLTPDTTMDSYAETAGDADRFYKMSTYDGNTEIESKVSFSFTEYVYGDQSMYIEDVVQDYLNNIGYIHGDVDGLYRVIEYYVTDATKNVGNLTDGSNANGIDILFGADRDGNYYNYYAISGNDIIAGKSIQFMNGSLGDFDPTVNLATRNSAIADAMVRAYTGEANDLIYDEVRFPFSFIFQASDNSDVIKSMADLVSLRESTDAVMYIPETEDGSYSSARTKKDELFADYDTSKMFFHTESAVVRDPYTHKRIRMPSTYFNAKAIPRLLTTYGYGSPLAGNNFYWDGFVTNSMIPRSTKDTEYIENHKTHINTMIEDGTGKAYAVEQITAQSATSALSEINNVITLSKICNIALTLAKNSRWTNLDDTEIGEFKSNLESAIAGTLSNAYNSITITAERESVNGAGRNRIHCKITVSFKSMLKGVTYDIYIV